MNLPSQSQPVARRYTAAVAGGVLPQGCSVWTGIKCAGTILACTAACCGGVCIPSPACIACMGAAYNECKDCF